MMFKRNVNMTPQTVGAQALVCFALPSYPSLRTHMYWFAYTALPSSVCGDALEGN